MRRISALGKAWGAKFAAALQAGRRMPVVLFKRLEKYQFIMYNNREAVKAAKIL